MSLNFTYKNLHWIINFQASNFQHFKKTNTSSRHCKFHNSSIKPVKKVVQKVDGAIIFAKCNPLLSDISSSRQVWRKNGYECSFFLVSCVVNKVCYLSIVFECL